MFRWGRDPGFLVRSGLTRAARLGRLVILALLLHLGPGQAQSPNLPFRIADLTPLEQRTLQAALSLEGYYQGLIDGEWGGLSQSALDAATFRYRGRGAEALADLLQRFIARRDAEGWRPIPLDGTGLHVAVPIHFMRAVRAEEGDVLHRFVAEDDTLFLDALTSSRVRAAGIHDWMAERAARNTEVYSVNADGRQITAVQQADGGRSYAYSHRHNGRHVTLILISRASSNGRLGLMAASISRMPQPAFTLPRGGQLARLAATEGGQRPMPPPPQPAAPTPPRPTPHTPGPGQPDRIQGSGTGFFVNPSDIVTARHVIEGCNRLTLEDGTELRLIESDRVLDLAVLASPVRSPNWLGVAQNTGPRLGQTAYALGYPYRGLIDSGLSVTSGNISALGRAHDPGHRIMLSAPVQPGNSGGPLVSADGTVLGVIVSRLDDLAILDATGTIPQNMNFATSVTSLVRFLRENLVLLPDPDNPPFNIENGLPDTVAEAVVPILCR
ncbi:S1C family serine protease [Roseicyclus elongatus]|nr:serine protease [Roseibacterium elongatum]